MTYQLAYFYWGRIRGTVDREGSDGDREGEGGKTGGKRAKEVLAVRKAWERNGVLAALIVKF